MTKISRKKKITILCQSARNTSAFFMKLTTNGLYFSFCYLDTFYVLFVKMVLFCENWCLHSLVSHFQLWNTWEYTVTDSIWLKTNTIKISNTCKIVSFTSVHVWPLNTCYFTEPTIYSMSDNIQYTWVFIKSGEEHGCKFYPK